MFFCLSVLLADTVVVSGVCGGLFVEFSEGSCATSGSPSLDIVVVRSVAPTI